MRIFFILCLMCASLAANPILQEKSGNNREILNLYNRMEKAIHPAIGDEGWEKYKSAIEFSATKHEGQFRKDKNKTPYIIHPMGVSFSLFREGDIRDLDTLIAALLHDTLEDTDTSFDEIKKRFGEKVAEPVRELTNDPNLTTEENKQRQVDHAPFLSPTAKLVKLSDRLYNVRDLNVPPPSWDHEKVASYLNWGKKLLAALKGTNEKMEKALEEEIRWQESKALDKSFTHNVGELGKKWALPSDHLPIGAKIGLHRFGSWNILATPYLHYIEKNDQGLKDSLILKLNYPAKNGLTERENKILESINAFFNSYSAFTLQEVTPEMFDAIIALLPNHFAFFPKTKEEALTELVMIYDTRKFDLLAFENHPFQVNSRRSFAVVDLQDKNSSDKYRFIGTHLPGGPKAKPARIELTEHLLRHYDSSFITVLMGDMNASPEALQNHFERSANLLHMPLPFKRIDVPYPTHINTVQQASFLDQIYVAESEGKALSSSTFSSEVESLEKLIKP